MKKKTASLINLIILGGLIGFLMFDIASPNTLVFGFDTDIQNANIYFGLLLVILVSVVVYRQKSWKHI